MHKFYIVFNGISDLELGIKSIKRPHFPSLKKRYNEYEIDGRNGKLYELLGYEDAKVEVEYNFVDKKSIHEKVRQIRKWLDNIQDNRLYFSDDPDYFYKVKKIEYEDIERRYKVLGKFKVTFICDCLARKFATNEVINISNNSTLYNEGDFESKPIFQITGNGAIKLWLNEKLITLNIASSITINSELELCYRNDEMMNSKMTGTFPTLNIGENTIRWEGNVSKVTIVPNYLYY